MPRIGKSKTPAKKRLLPPSKTQFAWAMAQRAEDKPYFHTRLETWDALGTGRAKLEAAAAAAAIAAAAAAANPDAVPAAPKIPPATDVPGRPTILAPTPTRRMVAPPSHLVFRTKVVTRRPRAK
jgi:hypothetical protein